MARILLELVGDEEIVHPPTTERTYESRHPAHLYSVERSLRPWGHFATAVINRRSEVIDASLPHRVTKLPPDAKVLPPEEVERMWHEDNESHVFGGPNVAKALRQAIAAGRIQ